MKIKQHHTSALVHASIKQSSLKLFTYLPPTNRNVFPHSRTVTFQACDKMDNLNQKCCHVTLSERKKQNFQRSEKIITTAYFFCRTFYQFYLLKYDDMTWKRVYRDHLEISASASWHQHRHWCRHCYRHFKYFFCLSKFLVK